MTKKEMLYNIISDTNLSGLNESDVAQIISKTKKPELERIYNAYINDTENALFYYWLLAGKCL